ncbi:8918_t:CDS:2 [Funneliformis mosseae]|uniref:8918_t:CDS:1 n=1 Tax=Funneliformis mosseae TaxID=27381 RepID=A0A9N8VCS4_FUNMO|nr:8918_t:CDS:2 [Funneliformis mosseae]
MSSELSLYATKPYRLSAQKHKPRRPSISTSKTDRLFVESLREEQFSKNQIAAKEYIEQTLGLKLPSNDLHEVLKDGVLLCSMMNRLRPDVIPQISRKDLAFVKMENINNFLNAARQLGLHTSDLFETVDLYEAKRMEKVVATILAIARVSKGKYSRRASDLSSERIEPPILEKLKDLDFKESEKSDSLKIRKSDKSALTQSENIDPNLTINPSADKNIPDDQTSELSTDNSDIDHSNSGISFHKKRRSLRKSVTMGQLFTKTLEQKQEEELVESEFAERLAPLPISPPAPTKSEMPVSRNSSTRSSRKTHVRYKSDRTSEISPNKNDRIPVHSEFKRRESVGGTTSFGDAPREKLVLKVGDEIMSQYQLGNCIGKGQFGAVYRALNLGTGQMAAVKRIKLEGKSPDEIEQLMQEVELLKSLSHPSVVKYESFIMTTDHINIILEYVENGSLLHTLKSFGTFPEKLVVSYVVKILEGLVYLHNKQVVHCDLKAANILTTKNGNVKLSDFGVSLNLKMMEQVSTEVAGTPNWMAPEIIELKGASTASDIWSLGCTIIELLTGKPPYSDLLAMTALFRIVEDDCPPLPESLSDDLTDFLKKCFYKSPSMRPTARDLFRHDWIKNNWTIKELRNQESLPFLRRIISDTNLAEIKPSSLSNASSNLDDTIIEKSYDEPNGEHELSETLSPRGIPITPQPSPITPVGSQTNLAVMPQLSPTSTKLFAATPMVPHRFVKNSFSKPVECRICHNTVKKHVVMCEECNMVCHSKCSPEAPWPCSLQNRAIRYIPLEVIEDPHSRFNNKNISSEIDAPTITNPVNSLSTPHPPTSTKRNRFSIKTKKEDSMHSQISLADSVDSSVSASSSSRPGSPNTADSSWYGNRQYSILAAEDSNHSNLNGNNGKGSGKGKAGKLKKRIDGASNGNGKKDEECVIM